nr:LysR family transcriptional regulator [Pseudomonas chengduensis]
MLDSLDELRLFLGVYEAGTIRAASERLGLSAAGGSKKLLALEDRLGRRLFNRTTRKLSPTPDAEKFHQYVSKILDLANQAEASLSQEQEISGSLRITASATFAQGYLAPMLSSYLALYPKVVIDLDPTDQVVDLVAKGFDLGIRHGVMADSSMIAQRISDSSRVICASPEYWAMRGLPQAPNDLSRLDGLIVGQEVNWTLSKGAIDQVIKVKRRFRSSQAEVIRQMALDGHGMALLADWHVRADLLSGALVKTLPDWKVEPNVGVYAVYPSKENMAPPVRAFIEHFKAWAAAHPIDCGFHGHPPAIP